jgi:U3 small nucleolar RNA-associated protein 10
MKSRINEFNVEDVLSLFLPYHDSPHFTKMVTILLVKWARFSFGGPLSPLLMLVRRPDAPWGFLNGYKSAAQSVPRTALITEMLRNVALSRFVASALPKAVKEQTVHRALVAFHTAVIFEYLSRIKALDDDILAFLLPAMLEPMQVSAARADGLTKDVVVSALLPLST